MQQEYTFNPSALPAGPFQPESYPPQEYMYSHVEPGYEGYGPAEGDMEGSGGDTDAEEDDGKLNYKSKPRRKATQKPQGSDQKRQAFSKRKRGLVLKAYQLYKLTDAKVFMFLVNDKGSTWAYASPGFGPSLHPSQLKRLRELAGYNHSGGYGKHTTEIMVHPRLDEQDKEIDDRNIYVGAVDPLPIKTEPRAGLPMGPQRTPMQRTPAGPRPLINGPNSTPSSQGMPLGLASSGLQQEMSNKRRNSGPVTGHGGMGMGNGDTDMYTGMVGGEMVSFPMGGLSNKSFGLSPGGAAGGAPGVNGAGRPELTDTTIANNALAMQPAPNDTSPLVQQSLAPQPQGNNMFSGHIITDAQGNMYRIVQEAVPIMPNHAPTTMNGTYIMQPTMDLGQSAMNLGPQPQGGGATYMQLPPQGNDNMLGQPAPGQPTVLQVPPGGDFMLPQHSHAHPQQVMQHQQVQGGVMGTQQSPSGGQMVSVPPQMMTPVPPPQQQQAVLPQNGQLAQGGVQAVGEQQEGTAGVLSALAAASMAATANQPAPAAASTTTSSSGGRAPQPQAVQQSPQAQLQPVAQQVMQQLPAQPQQQPAQQGQGVVQMTVQQMAGQNHSGVEVMMNAPGGQMMVGGGGGGAMEHTGNGATAPNGQRMATYVTYAPMPPQQQQPQQGAPMYPPGTVMQLPPQAVMGQGMAGAPPPPGTTYTLAPVDMQNQFRQYGPGPVYVVHT